MGRDVKPRLQPDIHFLPTDAGISVRAPGYSATLPVPGLYPWFERLRPFLDGTHSVVELVEKLSPAAAQRVLGLVEFLLREGFARDADYDLPHTLSAPTLDLHASMIGYLARLADSPERRFQSYRECAPVVVGSGMLLAATAHALLATGVENVRVHIAPGGVAASSTDVDALREMAAPLLHRDMSARLSFSHAEPRDLRPDVGALLYVADIPDATQSIRLRGLAARRSLRYGCAGTSGDRVLISPVTIPSAGERPATLIPDPAAGRPVSRYLGGPMAALAANQLCLHLLRHTAGLVDLDDGVSGQDSDRLADPDVLDLTSGCILTAP